MGNANSLNPLPDNIQNTIVIIGASFAGMNLTGALLKKNNQNLKIILVDKAAHFEFNPANYKSLADADCYMELSEPMVGAIRQFNEADKKGPRFPVEFK